MTEFAPLHWLADWLPPPAAAAVVLLLAAAVTIGWGLARQRRAFLPALPGPLAVALGVLPALGTRRPLLSPPLFAILAALVVALIVLARRLSRQVRPPADASAPTWPIRIWLAVAMLVMALFTLPRLGSYAGTLLTWETTVIDSFADAYSNGQDVLSFLGDRLLWDEGLVSRGQASLVYGGLTYALFGAAGFSPFTLRLVACLAGLATPLALFAFARRTLSHAAATLIAVVCSLHAYVLFYSRYGTSLSATLLTVTLGAVAVYVFLVPGRDRWWSGALAAAALVAATLHYATGRLVVVLLIGVAAVHVVLHLRQTTRRGLVSLALFLLLAVGFIGLQASNDVGRLFLSAGGEHIGALVRDPAEVSSYLGQAAAPPERGFAGTVAVARAVAARNWSGFSRLWSPRVDDLLAADPGSLNVFHDPPQMPLYFAPLLPFLLWGFVASLAGWRRWPHCLLLPWTVVTAVAVLLTNRVDSHRMVTLAVPVSVWVGLGMWDAGWTMRRAGVPVALRHALAAGLFATTVLFNVHYLVPTEPLPANPLVAAVVRQLEGLPGRVTVAVIGAHEHRALVSLELLERTRRHRAWQARPVPEPWREMISRDDPHVLVAPGLVIGLGSEIEEGGALLLTPAEPFARTAAALAAQGFKVRNLPGEIGAWLIQLEESGAAAPAAGSHSRGPGGGVRGP